MLTWLIYGGLAWFGYRFWSGRNALEALKSGDASSFTEVRGGIRYWTDETAKQILQEMQGMALVPAPLSSEVPPGTAALFQLVQSSPAGVNARVAVQKAVQAGMGVSTSGTLAAAIHNLSSGPQFIAIHQLSVTSQICGIDRLFVALAGIP